MLEPLKLFSHFSHERSRAVIEDLSDDDVYVAHVTRKTMQEINAYIFINMKIIV